MNNRIGKDLGISSNLKTRKKIPSNSKIETNGSISRGVTIGSNQNSVLNSELDLQISGELSDGVKIKASIQDSNIPLQNDGYSQQIDEFDQIFIEISSNDWMVRGGDIDINQENTFFENFKKVMIKMNVLILLDKIKCVEYRRSLKDLFRNIKNLLRQLNTYKKYKHL